MISSRSNPLIQQYRKLKQHLPDREGHLFLEGIRLIREAEKSAVSFETVFYTPRMADSPAAKDLLDRCRRRQENIPAHEVSESVLEALSLEETPPGLLAIAKGPLMPFSTTAKHSVLVLCGLQDPGNAGALVRTAEACGSAVWFSEDSVHPSHPKVVKAGMGSLFRVPCGRGPIVSLLKSFRDEGRRLIGAKSSNGIPYTQMDWKSPFALFLGNEGAGLPPDVDGNLSHSVSIPMEGAIESLNVAVAGAIILFEAKRRSLL